MVLLLACTQTEPLPAGDSGAPSFAGIERVRWDGGDGLEASWSPGTGVSTYKLHAGDEVLETSETSATVSGLADGEYEVWVTAEGLGAEVVLVQLVGENRLVHRGELPFEGGRDVAGEGDLAVLAGGLHPEIDLLVADVSDPSAPVTLAEISGLGEVADVHLEDGILYAATEDGDGIGVFVYDLSRPEAPELLATLEGAVHNLHAGGGHLYTADTSEQVVGIFDVADPAAPARVGSWGPDGGPHDVAWVDGRLYVAGTFGFAVLDASDPGALSELHRYDEPLGAGLGVHNAWPSQDGEHVFTTREELGGRMEVWSLGYEVERVAAWPDEEPNCVHNVHVDGEHAFAAWYHDGARVFDVSEPAAPELIGWYDTYDEGDDAPADLCDIQGAWGIWPYGERVLVGDTAAGLIVLDFFPLEVRVE